jgi:hypothetical protein
MARDGITGVQEAQSSSGTPSDSPARTPPLNQEIRVSTAQTSSSGQRTANADFAGSRSSSYGSFVGQSTSNRSLVMGFDARGVGWKNRWVVLIAALWIQVRDDHT